MWIRAIGAALRIAVGAALIASGLVKLLDPGFLYGGLIHRLREFGEPFPWYSEYVLQRFVQTHLDFFAYAIPIAEIAAGLSFLFGLLVSWSACGAAFLVVNVGLSIGRSEYWILPLHAALALLLLVLGRAGAGLTWGLDGLLIGKMPAALVLFPLRHRLPEEFRRMYRAPARNYPSQVQRGRR